MRILTLDPSARPLEPCDAEVLLARRVSSSDRLTATRWQMLLDLVEVLRAGRPNAEVCGLLDKYELCLYPMNQVPPLWVHVWADAPDYGPLRDGLPVLHYRVRVQRGGVPLSTDARMERPDEAGRFIEQVFSGLV